MNPRLVTASMVVAACGGAPPPVSISTTPPANAAQAYPGCHATAIEPDLKPTPTQVVNAATATSGDVWISSTYLALTPDPKGQATFRSLMADLLRVLPTTPGLISFEFSTSESCLSARTLAVWHDEAAMDAFVRSPAHYAAMRQSNALSRGTSTFTRWHGPIESATWNHAAKVLAEQDGPYQ